MKIKISVPLAGPVSTDIVKHTSSSDNLTMVVLPSSLSKSTLPTYKTYYINILKLSGVGLPNRQTFKK